MNDIFKSLKAYLYDRSVSPLTGAFIMAWSVWNYRVFLTIFAGKEQAVEAIFQQIDNLFKSSAIFGIAVPINGALFNGFLIPAGLTLSYIYVYPLLAKPVYEHSLRKQKALREIRQQEESNRLLTVEESREIYRQLSNLQDENLKETEDHAKQILALTQTINDLESQQAPKTDQVVGEFPISSAPIDVQGRASGSQVEASPAAEKTAKTVVREMNETLYKKLDQAERITGKKVRLTGEGIVGSFTRDMESVTKRKHDLLELIAREVVVVLHPDLEHSRRLLPEEIKISFLKFFSMLPYGVRNQYLLAQIIDKDENLTPRSLHELDYLVNSERSRFVVDPA